MGGSVERFEICKSSIRMSQLRKLLQIFLPTLKTCVVSEVLVHNVNEVSFQEWEVEVVSIMCDKTNWWLKSANKLFQFFSVTSN